MPEEKEETVREVVRGLGGLAMLAEWQMSLARDLRKKAASLLPEDDQRPLDDGLIGRPD